MPTLNRRLVVQQGNQTVQFKFSTDSENPRAHNLETDKKVRRGMLNAFLRAQRATTAAVQEFDNVSYDRRNKLITGATKLVSEVLSAHFGNVQQEQHLQTIKTTFAILKKALHSDITISDFVVDPAIAKGAEGIVNPRRKAGGPERMDRAVQTGLAETSKELIKEGVDTNDAPGFARGKLQHQELRKLPSTSTRSIHVAFRFCKHTSVDYMARLIIHEASHKFAQTGDVASSMEKAFRRMTPELAVINADSYAFAAISLLRGEIATDAILGAPPYAVDDKADPQMDKLRYADIYRGIWRYIYS